MTDIGPHLLGRLPSPPDPRDYRLENFVELGHRPGSIRALAAVDPVALATDAVSQLKQTTVTYKKWAATQYPDVTTTRWWKAFNDLALIIGVNPPPAPTGDVEWPNAEPTLDQGDFGTCVGNGGAQWGNTEPYDDKFTEGMGQPATTGLPTARAIYYETTVLDGSPDDPDMPGGGQQGATPRSLMKVLKARGRLSTYAVTTAVATVAAWIDAHGPVVFGTDWTDDMFDPSPTGYVRPTGAVAGGHCYVAVGHLKSEDAIKFLNSWGAGWGLGGYFKMKTADVQQLLSAQGEAWTAPELPIA